MTQQTDTKPLTLVAAVAAVLSDGDWRTADALKAEIFERYTIQRSTSAVMAALRDLRKPHKGGYVIDSQFDKSIRAWQYRMTPARQAKPL